MECIKAHLGEYDTTCNLNKHRQKINIEYMNKAGNINPKVAISIITTIKGEQEPRSFRTDDPELLRRIIKSLLIGYEKLKSESNPQPKIKEIKTETFWDRFGKY